MRLTSAQVDHITKVLRSHSSSKQMEIFLYGSRTDDSLKGGDIDLLVITNNDDCTQLKKAKFAILNEIKKSPEIGERRIDLKISTPEELQTDPFLKTASRELKKIG